MIRCYRLHPVLIIILFSWIGLTGVLAAPNETVGEELLLQVKNSISDSLLQADQNLSDIARVFGTQVPENRSVDEIIGPYKIEKPGVLGVMLLADNTTLISLADPNNHKALDSSILQDTSVGNTITYKKPQVSLVKEGTNNTSVVLMNRPAVVGRIIGDAVLIIDPWAFSDAIVRPVINGTDALCVLMQPDGTILYTSHPQEMDKVPPENFQTEFPTFRDLIRRMIAEKEGSLIYDLWRADRSDPRSRTAFWNTITIHGTDWRVMTGLPH